MHAETIEAKNYMLNTTVGRVILYDNLPKGMPFINGLLKKKGLGQLVSYTLPALRARDDGHDARSHQETRLLLRDQGRHHDFASTI